MAESVEISATSVDDAIELALAQLGRERAEVEVQVLRSPGEPDEHGYASDEALVLVTALHATAMESGTSQARAPRAPRRQQLSPGDRMRVAESAQETLSDLLHHLGIVASCHVSPQSVNTNDPEAPVIVEVEGEDLGVLIGRRGDNLAALQYILGLMVQKQVGLWPNLQVDVAGYRRRREETLEGLARRMARRVLETQQPFTFEPMPARERRILHVTIQDDRRVETESIGEGDDRRVVIYPAE